MGVIQSMRRLCHIRPSAVTFKTEVRGFLCGSQSSVGTSKTVIRAWGSHRRAAYMLW